jgi:GTPase SAR1 family protein
MTQIVDAVFPYIFVILPLTIFIVVVFILFVIANSGEIDWYARHLDQRLIGKATLDELTGSAITAIGNAFEKYEEVSARKVDDVQKVSLPNFITILKKIWKKSQTNFINQRRTVVKLKPCKHYLPINSDMGIVNLIALTE